MTETKEQWLNERREEARLTTLEEISEILSSTIKHDEESKLITFLGALLTYTSEDQINLFFKSESARGKSYIPLEIAQFFPKEDVIIYGYASPTAFFHEYGIWVPQTENAPGYIVIDLHQKLLIFLDQPHDQLLQRLRPLLSHDQKRITIKITDKREKHGLRTKTVILEGYPTVIFCSTKVTLEEQEKTRAFLLSPEATQDKLKDSLALLTKKLADRENFQKEMESDPKRKWLLGRVMQIRTAHIDNVILSEEIAGEIYAKFLEAHPNLEPRHQRDFPRFIALIKAHALLNLWNRERIDNPTQRCIQANMSDVQEGFRLYNQIAEANEAGLDPEIWEIWKKVFEPNIMLAGVSLEDIYKKYRKIFGRFISNYRLTRIVLPALESAGLIYQDNDPEDKRRKRYYAVEIKQTENIYAKGVG